MLKNPTIPIFRILLISLFLFSLNVHAQDENNEGSEDSLVTDLVFTSLEPVYDIGEIAIVDLEMQVNVASRFHRVDLWVVIEMSSGDLLFMTPFPFQKFSAEPQPFMLSLERTDIIYRVLEFEVIPGFSGDYTFYALYVKEGTNPMTDSFLVIRSNIATATTTLRDRVVP